MDEDTIPEPDQARWLADKIDRAWERAERDGPASRDRVAAIIAKHDERHTAYQTLITQGEFNGYRERNRTIRRQTERPKTF